MVNNMDYLHKRWDAWRQEFFVISELTKREIKRKYVRSFLGTLWSVLHPLMYMLVMSFIFSSMFRSSIDHFAIYYLAGYLIWDLFNQITSRVLTVLVDNRTLLLTVKVRRQVFVLSRCYTALVNFLLSLIPFVVLLCAFRIRLTPVILLMPVGIFFCILFSLGIGYMLSILYVFFADIEHLYSLLLTLWMFSSAVFYPIDSVSEQVQAFIRSNPVYSYITFMRDTAVYGIIPDMTLWVSVIGWGVIIYAVGLYVFRRFENQVMIRL